MVDGRSRLGIWIGSSLGFAIVAGLFGFMLGKAGTSRPPQSPSISVADAAPVGLAEALEAAVSKTDDPVDRAIRVVEVLQRLDVSNAPEAARVFQGRSDEWVEYETRLFLWKWSAVDPVGALRAAVEWSPNLRDAASYAAARAWARADPRAAQEAVEDELEGIQRSLATSLKSGLAHGWIESGDFDGAKELIAEDFQSLLHRETLAEMLAQRMLRERGLPDSFKWAEVEAGQNVDRAFLSIVFRKIARTAVLEDPVATSTWLEGFEGHPSYMNRARRAAAVMWARQDARAALEWTLSRPTGNSHRVTSLTTVLVDWAGRDPGAALAWLRAARRDRGLDEGISLVSDKIARRSPSEAVEWASLVSDEKVRQRSLVVAGSRWAVEDEAAASAWLDSGGFGPGFRKSVHAGAALLLEEATAQ